MALSNLIVKISADTKEFVVGTTRVKRDAEGLKGGMKMLSQAITEGNMRLKEMAASGRGASKEYKELKTQVAQARSALRGMGGELSTLQKTAGGGFGGGQIASALTGGLIGGGAISGAIAGMQKIGQVFTETLQVTVSFDDAIRKVGATSSASSDQMDALRNAAIEMGSQTRFTASQAAEALNYMALAGWNTEQSIAGLPGILNLAAAASMDLGQASDILTDTMAAFSMEAQDSGKVADVFAQVQSKANTTVEMLGEAMKYAAPQFASAGQTIETTSTIIGLLANQGIKASMAGTAMNAMLKDLKKGAAGGVLEFGNMNIALYNTDGTMRNMLDVIRDMRKGVEGLTQQQRDAITGGLFEERSIKAVNILLNTTGDVINNLETDLLKAEGRASSMADTMEGGVGGALRKMQSAWEGLQLTIAADGGIAQAWYNAWSRAFAAFSSGIKYVGENIQNLKIGVGAITAGVIIFNAELIRLRVTALATAAAKKIWAAATWAVKIAQDALNFSMSANPVGALLKGIGLLVGGLGALYLATRKAKTETDSIKKATDDVVISMEKERSTMNATFKVLKDSNVGSDTRKRLIDQINQKYGEYLPNLLNEKSSLQDIESAQRAANDAFRENITLKAAEAKATAVMEKRLDLEQQLIKAEQQLAEDIQKGSESARQQDMIMGAAATGVTANISFIKDEIAKLESQYQSIIGAAQSVGKSMDDAGDAAANQGAKTLNTIKAINDHIKALKEEQESLEIGSKRYKEVTAEIDRYEKMLEKSKKAKKLQVRVVSNLMGVDETTMFELTDKMRKQVAEANILQGIFKNVNALDEEIKAVSEVIKGGIEAGVDPTVLQPYIDKLKELEEKKLGPNIFIDDQGMQMSEMMAGIAESIAKDKRLAEAFKIKFNEIGAETSALAEAIRNGIDNNMDAELLQPMIDKYNELADAQRKLTETQQLATDVINGFGQSAASAFEAIGSGSMTAAQGFAAVGKAAIGASLDFLKGKLLESIGLQTKFGAKYGPVGIAIAGAGIAALFALVKGAVAKSRAVAFADGGIVSGPVMGLVGEYAGASRNPEVIAPLDKLQSMLQGSGSTHVTGTFRVQGSDLVLALDNAQRKMNQFRV